MAMISNRRQKTAEMMEVTMKAMNLKTIGTVLNLCTSFDSSSRFF